MMLKEEITISEIAEHLGVNKWTVYRWIEWYFSDLKKPEGIYLPPYRLKGTSKIFKRSDLKLFEDFRRDLPFGAMREYTRYRFKKLPKDPKVALAIRNSRHNQRCQMLNNKEA